MRVNEKAYAKINLCLNVYQKQGEYHPIDSLVATVDLFDKVTVSSRKDKKITLRAVGPVKEYVYGCNPLRDNAYKAAEAFMQAFDVNGVDIIVDKRIPLSSGMGGSSTDASAVLRAMERIYKTGGDITSVASSLGSDTAYLLNGGFARLGGRGEKVESLEVKGNVEILAVFPESGVSSADCFAQFDRQPIENAVYGDIEALIASLNGDELAYNECKNGLQSAACQLNADVKAAIEDVRALSPKCVFMTGSGSAVCAIFNYSGLYEWAREKLSYKYKCMVLKTLTPKLKA